MSESTLRIDCKPGREGKSVVTVHIGDDVIACERVDLFDPKSREDLARRITTGRKGLKAEAVLHELEKAAATVAGAGPDEPDEKEPQAAALVTLAEGDELFHDPTGELALASVTVGEGDDQHVEIHPINGKGYRQSLARRFYNTTKRPPNAQAMQDAIQVLTGKAIFDGPARPTAIRIALHEGAQYLDLADDRWGAVKLTSAGALIVNPSPVPFLRKRGMQALPLPDLAAGPEALNDLRPLMNADCDRRWRMILAYMIGAMRPTGPYPSLSFMHSAAESMIAAGKNNVIFYFGDYDPSGVDIPRVVESTLRELIPNNVGLIFSRVAVNEQQISEMSLQTRPTKRSDTRAKNFKGESVEVDAIPPDTLRDICRHCIERFIDRRALEMVKQSEKSERDYLQNLARRFAEGNQ